MTTCGRVLASVALAALVLVDTSSAYVSNPVAHEANMLGLHALYNATNGAHWKTKVCWEKPLGGMVLAPRGGRGIAAPPTCNGGTNDCLKCRWVQEQRLKGCTGWLAVVGGVSGPWASSRAPHPHPAHPRFCPPARLAWQTNWFRGNPCDEHKRWYGVYCNDKGYVYWCVRGGGTPPPPLF